MCLHKSLTLRDQQDLKSTKVFKVMQEVEVDGGYSYIPVFYTDSGKHYVMGDCQKKEYGFPSLISDIDFNHYPTGIHCFLSLEDAKIYRDVMGKGTGRTGLVVVACTIHQKDISSVGITKISHPSIKWEYVSLFTIVVDRVQLQRVVQ